MLNSILKAHGVIPILLVHGYPIEFEALFIVEFSIIIRPALV